MRRTIAFLLLAAALLSVSTSHGAVTKKKVGNRTLEWSNVRQCGPTCPRDANSTTSRTGFTSPDQRKAVCQKTPFSLQNTWMDIFVTVPKSISGYTPAYMNLTIDPRVDWDVYACKVTSDKVYYQYMAGPPPPASSGPPSTSCAEAFSGDVSIVSIGCPQHIRIKVAAGQSYVLRAYNRIDVTNNLTGAFWYEGVKVSKKKK